MPAIELNNDALVRRVIARITETGHAEAIKFLKGSNVLGELVMGMSAEAKKDGARFGVWDAKEALAAWFDGGREPRGPAQIAARRYLLGDGKFTLKKVTDAVHRALKAGGAQVGYRDIGDVLLEYLG